MTTNMYYTVDEVADMLSVCSETVRRMIRRKEIEAKLLPGRGRRLFVFEAEYERLKKLLAN